MAITDVEDKVVHFRTFFNKNFPKVKTFAWQLLKSEEDAEDRSSPCSYDSLLQAFR